MKPALHQSQLSLFANCGMAYYWRYVEGIQSPPGVALLTGTATHAAIEHNYRHKIATGQLLPEEQVTEIAADTVRHYWDEGVMLDEEEKTEGEDAVRGQTIDMATRLSALHHREIAPQVNPIAIERTFRLKLDNYPVDLVGTIDVEEASSVRDNKTYKRTPSQEEVDRSLQMTVYALAKRTADGREPRTIALDVLLKTRKAAVKVIQTRRTAEDYRSLLRRIEVVTNAIEKGVFVPTVPDDWRCSAKFCGYFGRCEFGSRGRGR